MTDQGVLDLLGPRVGRAHRDGTDTELAAAAKMAGVSGELRRRVLLAFAHAGDEGLTAFELSVKAGIVLPTSADTRRKELAEHGYVEFAGIRRPNDRGNPCRVHRITEKGLDLVRRLEDK